MVRTYTFAAMCCVAYCAVSSLNNVFEWMADRKEKKIASQEQDILAAKLRKELIAENEKKGLVG